MNKNYRAENKARIKKRRAQHYLDNRDKFLEYSQEYYWNNKEKIQPKKHAHYLKNKSKYIEKNKKHYAENKDMCKARRKEFHARNPNYFKEYCKQWRLKKEAEKVTNKECLKKAKKRNMSLTRFLKEEAEVLRVLEIQKQRESEQTSTTTTY